MTILRILLVWLLSGALPAAQAANLCNSGVARQQAESGMGGTGQVAHGGIGGTGSLAWADSGASGLGGTGIVGIVTGFASLCVNGQEVFYDAGTPMEIDGHAMQAEKLERGQMVVVEAVAQAGHLNATRIQVVPVITAPLEGMQPAPQGWVRVLGRTLPIPDTLLGQENLQTGRMVSLSGLVRPNGELLLLRADPAREMTQTGVTQTEVTQTEVTQTEVPQGDTPQNAPQNAPQNVLVTVNGVLDAHGRIAGVPLSGVQGLQRGREWRVQGVWNGQALQVTRYASGASATLARAGRGIAVQGYVADGETPGRWQINGHAVALNAQTRIVGQPARGAGLVIVRGVLGAAGEIIAAEIEHGRERDILERGGSRQRPERVPLPGAPAHAAERGAAPVERHVEAHGEGAALQRPEPLPRPERPDRMDRMDRMEHIERFESVARPGRLDMPRPEQPPRPDPPPRPPRHDRGGR